MWNPGNNNDTKTVGNTTVRSFGDDAELTWGGNGFGVNSDDDDSSQIEENEKLRVTFSNLAFELSSFSVTRLANTEDGYYRTYSAGVWSNWTKFDGVSDSNSNRTVTVSPIWVTALEFGYYPSFNDEDHFFLKNVVGNWQQTAASAPSSALLP